MSRLYMGIALLVVSSIIGATGYFMINRIATLTAEKAVLETANGLLRGEVVGLKVDKHESTARQDALTRQNNKAAREQRAASTLFREGLNNDTETTDGGVNRALADVFIGMQRATTSTDNPDH